MPKVRPPFWIWLVAGPFALNFLFSNGFLVFKGMPPTCIEVRPFDDRATVSAVEQKSLASRAGILPGDVVLSVGGKSVTGSNHYLLLEQLLPADLAVPFV